MLCLQDLRPDTKMVETCIPLCKECMALTIGDKIMDYLSKDFPSDPQHHSGPPELMVEWQKWDTIPSLSNLTAAADAGCQFCAFLLVFILRCCDKYVFSDQLYCEKDFEDAQMSVKIDQVRYVREHDPNVIGYLGSTRQDHRRLVGLAADIRIYSRNSQEEFCYTTAWFPLSSEDDSQRSSKIGAKQISHQPLSSENLAMITTWIKDCDSHMQCSLKPSQLPTRLVDIGNAKDETSIRLINVADYKDLRDQLSHYVALSYCWGTEAGGQSHLKTTPSSFETFLSCIPYEAIPQTLRDVVQVVRKLGLRYIWIDALCIIQEEADQADWKHESLKMKDVYGNAYLTIAPISSHSSFDGFLASKRYIYAQIPFRSTKRPEMNSIFLLREPTSEGRVWHGTFVDDLRDSTWDHRGWTLQEHELSRRILYFGERTVHFRCDTLSWSGDMDVADSKRDRLLPKASDLSWVSCQIPGLKESFPFDSTYDFWYTICSLYSDRILTDNRDKLPAISGLAEHYSISLKSAGKVDTYMAGLWANDLLRGLLWNVVETPDTSLSPLPTSSCTPSWTWASYNGGVDWYTYGASSRLIRGRCTIMAHLPFIDQSPFGMIDGGCLEIKGCIEKITSIAQAATHDDQTLCEHLSYSAKRNNVVVAECQPDFPFEDLQHWPGGSNLSLLLLGESVDAGHLNRLPWEVGLVLAQAHYGGEPRFVRIGVFRIREESSFFKNSQPQLVMVL